MLSSPFLPNKILVRPIFLKIDFIAHTQTRMSLPGSQPNKLSPLEQLRQHEGRFFPPYLLDNEECVAAAEDLNLCLYATCGSQTFYKRYCPKYRWVLKAFCEETAHEIFIFVLCRSVMPEWRMDILRDSLELLRKYPELFFPLLRSKEVEQLLVENNFFETLTEEQLITPEWQAFDVLKKHIDGMVLLRALRKSCDLFFPELGKAPCFIRRHRDLFLLEEQLFLEELLEKGNIREVEGIVLEDTRLRRRIENFSSHRTAK